MSKNKESSVQSLDSVDQIRNILFGEQITLIEQRFSQLEEKLTQAIAKLSDKVDKNTSDLNHKIDSTDKQLQADSANLAQEQSEDLKRLEINITNKISETESDLLNQFQKGLDQLSQKASHRNELAQLLNDMAHKLAD